MTAREVRQLSHTELDALYATLRADRLPVGTFDGVTWPVPVWPFWRGKVFEPMASCKQLGKVVNRIGPFHFVRGYVVLGTQDAWIRYPGGLLDFMRPVSETLWLGYLRLGPVRVWFTLEHKP